MKTISIGVVIPVYNGEAFLDDCLMSVLGQTIPVTEIIVVDDGSTDATPRIAETYKEKGVRIIRQKNAGQGSARNRALQEVTSDFVMFLDADDKLAPDLVETVIRRLVIQPDADVVHFNWQFFSYDKSGRQTYFVKDHDPLLKEMQLQGDACDKLLTITNYFAINNVFRRTFLLDEKIAFSEGMIYEDNALMVKVATRARSVLLVDAPLYYYRRDNPGSSSRSDHKSPRHYEDVLRAMRESVDSLAVRTPDTAYYLLNYYLQKIIVYYERRIPKGYKGKFIKQAVDILSELNVDRYPHDAPKITKLVIRGHIIQKRRYWFMRCLTVAKVILSRLKGAQS